MDAPQRGVLSFIRLVAACLILIGFLDTGIYVAHCFRVKKPATVLQSQGPPPAIQFEQSAPVKVLPIAINSIPLVAGVVILFKTRAIADWISEKLE